MDVEVNNLVSARVSKSFIIHVLTHAYTNVSPKQRIDNVSVALVDAITIKTINRKYRKQNRVTDVLSFDDTNEIIICWQQLVSNAKKNKVSQKKELALILVHGFLHIVCYDHKARKDKIKMEKREREILRLIS